MKSWCETTSLKSSQPPEHFMSRWEVLSRISLNFWDQRSQDSLKRVLKLISLFCENEYYFIECRLYTVSLNHINICWLKSLAFITWTEFLPFCFRLIVQRRCTAGSRLFQEPLWLREGRAGPQPLYVHTHTHTHTYAHMHSKAGSHSASEQNNGIHESSREHVESVNFCQKGPQEFICIYI